MVALRRARTRVQRSRCVEAGVSEADIRALLSLWERLVGTGVASVQSLRPAVACLVIVSCPICYVAIRTATTGDPDLFSATPNPLRVIGMTLPCSRKTGARFHPAVTPPFSD